MTVHFHSVLCTENFIEYYFAFFFSLNCRNRGKAEALTMNREVASIEAWDMPRGLTM